jgi:hypothetical protein
MPLSGKLSVGVWKIRLRVKWSIVKIDDPQIATKKIGPVDTGVRQIIDGNQIQDGCHSSDVG